MKTTAVSSSAIRTVAYDEATRVLRIEFHNNAVYEYSDIPAIIYGELLSASSKGRYFEANIKGSQYNYRRLV